MPEPEVQQVYMTGSC